MAAAMAGGPASASARGGRQIWLSSSAVGAARGRQVVAVVRGALVPFSDLKVPSSTSTAPPTGSCLWWFPAAGAVPAWWLEVGRGHRRNPRSAGPATTAASSLDAIPLLVGVVKVVPFPLLFPPTRVPGENPDPFGSGGNGAAGVVTFLGVPSLVSLGWLCHSGRLVVDGGVVGA